MAGGNFVEPVAVIDDDAGEHIQPSRGAFGVGQTEQLRRKTHLLQKRNEVNCAFFQNAPRSQQVEFVQRDLLEFVFDGFVFRQETALDAVCLGPQPQVQAHRLKLGLKNRRFGPELNRAPEDTVFHLC